MQKGEYKLGEALLRIRGGISRFFESFTVTFASSPHTRRYFHKHGYAAGGGALFSAYAEVFP